MKRAMILAAMLLLSTGCLDLLRYSERTCTHTLGMPPNGSRVCYFDMNESGTFSYELCSAIPVNFVIAERDELEFNESTGEPIIEGMKSITKAYNVENYTDDIELERGSYAFVITDSESAIEVGIKTNIMMDCGD